MEGVWKMKPELLGALAGLLIIILASIADRNLYNQESEENDDES
jgi:hypothetical protein